MRRTSIFALLIGISLPAFSEEKQTAMKSPEVRAAHEAWQKNKAKAVKAADDWYLQRLRKLKASAEGRDFELATAIGEEIRQVEFSTMLISKKWKWIRGNDFSMVRFTEDGEMIHPGFKVRWTLMVPGTVVLMLPNGRVASLIYDPAKESFSCRDFDGSSELKLEEE